jgi:predicted glycosyltransferase
MKKVMLYCQHVLGMGHLMRSMALVEGLRDFEVCFVNGGEMIPGFAVPPGVTMVQLPVLKSDADFQQLESADGQNVAAIEAARTEMLLAEFERFRPDALIVELFPFGRKKFAFELVPLLARIRSEERPVKVICSLRDILVSRPDPEKYEARVVGLMNRYFDALLVHADPTWQRLEETFQRVNDLTVPVVYTGYVAQRNTDHEPIMETAEDVPVILVSIGGGRVGHELISAAIAASGVLQAELPHQMRLFTGPFLPAEQWPPLAEQAAEQPQVTLQSYTPHFLAQMEQSDLSISLAGYNTCMNILSTGVRALLLPFSGGGNDEQARRAHKLAGVGLVGVLEPADLEPARLAAHIRQRLAMPKTAASLDMAGIEKTAAFLTELVKANDTVPSPQLRPLPPALRTTLERLEAEGRPIHLFVRDDDIDEDEERLRHLLDIGLANGVPLSLAVIPGRLTEAGIRLLKEHKRFHPALIELHQHGWLHLNHEVNGRKCEFGPSRSLAQQLADIAEGKAVLAEIFGDRFYPAFTPPWNRCTAETLAVLDQLGFAVFSKDNGEPVTGYSFREISITLDLFTWLNGAQLKPPAELTGELVRQMAAGLVIGLLLHHKVMDGEAFAFLGQLLAELRGYANVHFHTLQSLNELLAAPPLPEQPAVAITV